MNLLFYLLQVHIALTLLYIAYRTLFARDTHFVARRLLLLGMLLFTVSYPFYRILPIETALSATLQFSLPEVRVGPGTASDTTPFTPYTWVAWCYTAIVLLLMLRSTIGVMSIAALRKKGNRVHLEGESIIACPDRIQPCSFFKWIFLPASAIENPAIYTPIIKHEKAHIRQMHSIDILLAETFAALCWINPVAWLLLKEVRLNLEYMADRAALDHETEKKSYQYLLLDLACSKPNPSASSTIPFNHSFLKERIAMINRHHSSRLSLFRYLLVAPLCLLLVIGSQSCRESSPAKRATTSNTANTPIPSENITADTATIGTSQEAVLDVAEVMPEFPGGIQALYKTISQNLKYPQGAIDTQTEGRVVLRFVIDKQGKVSNIEVLRSVTPELDQAAIDVVRTLPAWQPGRQDGKPVNVSYTLPIAFHLS